MPKKPKALSALEVSRLTRPGFHAVGGVSGLYLRVVDTGARYWVLRYATPERRVSSNGKPYSARRDLGIGPYPEIGLAAARSQAAEFREQIRNGIDPAQERKDKRRAWADSLRQRITFEEAARKTYAAKAPEFKNARHSQAWIGRLERYAFPKIGHIPVAEIEVEHVLSVLEPIWRSKTETASRVRMRMEAVFTWATVSGYRSGENPARWRGNLKELLPDPSKIQKVEHYAALPWVRLPAFVAELRERDGMGARALEFLIYTAARSGEVRLATWKEIDLAAKLWTIPGERMKNGRPHRVPLTDDVVQLLKALPRMAGSDYLFTSAKGGPLSDMTISAVTKRLHAADVDAGGPGYVDETSGKVVVPHGFRSSFKDWARNRTGYPDEVSELALAHVSSDATRAAYARDELLPQRTRLMAEWGRFLRQPAVDGEVVPMRGAQ